MFFEVINMSLSLKSSVRSCTVDAGWAERLRSERIFCSNDLSCPTWGGRDNVGRQVCADSFKTKSEGCNSPLDRIYVENAQRPQYSEYITLDPSGYNSPFANGSWGASSAVDSSGWNNVPCSNGSNMWKNVPIMSNGSPCLGNGQFGEREFHSETRYSCAPKPCNASCAGPTPY